MRKVILGMNVTVDGYVARPTGELDWMFPQIDAEKGSAIAEELSEIETFLMGRATYEGMAAHWPTASDPIAPLMNQAQKIVFSSVLQTLDWQNATLAAAGPAQEIARLKQQPGGTIGVAGGAKLAQTLSAERLIDEYRLTIHPVALGAGLPLFTDPINLRHLKTRTFGAGAVTVTYQPA